MGSLVYFSSVSENTRRFVERLGFESQRIPLTPKQPFLKVHEPYVLVVPTYGGGNEGGAVPRQVVKFLNDEGNRSHLRGVIAAGNTNFGAAYCIAGDIVAAKCQVPYLYAFELLGTNEDVTRVREGLRTFWQRQRLTPA
ncbi:class Ib ribonucleoside-diphosphate reductase assembly flavoprotein NrdI [soil metagenome]